jgi:hypothetical protein
VSRKKPPAARGSSNPESGTARRNPPPAPNAGDAASPRRRRWGWPLALAGLALVGLLGVGLIVWGMRQPSARRGQPIGLSCASFPPFAQRLGFSARATLDTSDTHQPGLRLIEPAANGQPARIHQDPSWTQAGFLGTPVLDTAGNIYVAPVPQTSLILNPPEQQTRVYKIDGQTGQMGLFATVPAAQAPPPENPFGILGLAVDCQTNSLYAASVAGSTRQQEVGRIARIDMGTGQVTSQIDGIDGFGLVAGREKDVSGGRLYVGRARTPEIWSIALDQQGNLVGQAVQELAFGSLLADGDGRVRRLILAPNGTLSLIVTPFVYTLAPPYTSPQRLTFTYDPAKKSWQPLPEQGG